MSTIFLKLIGVKNRDTHGKIKTMEMALKKKLMSTIFLNLIGVKNRDTHGKIKTMEMALKKTTSVESQGLKMDMRKDHVVGSLIPNHKTTTRTIPSTRAILNLGNENYSRWQEDMENYFWEYKVPEHKKLSIALDTLEECRIYFKEPTPHWEYVKELMYEHFEMRRLPPRTCPKRFVKLKPRQLHEREVTLTSHHNSYDQFRLYKFSGKGEDPRNYLQWEEDME
ncbi:hypothetical protein HID58_093394, partial [Brassica napus]